MLGISTSNLRVGGYRGKGLSAEYTAILARATALGYTLPSANQQIKQNSLIEAFKTANIWSKMDIFYVFANDGSKEFATLNWKNPNAHQCTLVNSPTFTSNDGFLGNGTSSYIDTNFNPASSGVNYTLNDASIFTYNKTYVLNAFISGTDTGANNCLRMSPTSGNQRINMGFANTFTPAVDFDSSTFKFRKLSRTNLTTGIASKNITQTTHIGTSTTIESQNQLILKSAAQFANLNVASFGMGANLVTENTDHYNLIENYITTL